MKVIAYDLGTGGVKASLYNEKLETLAKSFIEYETFYPKAGYHEQRPVDWWDGIIKSTKTLFEKSGIEPKEVACVSLSGHSLVTVPIDKDKKILLDQLPIWSDTRAELEAAEFFTKFDETAWYLKTGNGFPPACYSIFKLIWLKKNRPDVFGRINKVLGSKDFINFMLTGAVYTDYSYASGMGAYSLEEKRMSLDILDAAGIPLSIFPEIVPSHYIVGKVSARAAAETGLAEGTSVACGGVDNACMALGAVGPQEGKIYTSLGSSSWIPVNSVKPILDPIKRPYVFAHIQEDLFTSAFSIFAGGSSMRWARETLCKDLEDEKNAYQLMDKMALQVPAGSNGIFFNPSLAGGTSQDKNIHIRGAFIGLHLGTTREDMVRAVMEGTAMNLCISLNFLSKYANISEEILFTGGGSKSSVWMQIFADVFNKKIIKTNIDQDAASIGAAAAAARAMGLWKDYAVVPQLHQIQTRVSPQEENTTKYAALLPVFIHMNEVIADLGGYIHESLKL
jgi:xylulokinase